MDAVWDVVIVGGGPAGTTVATLLRKYNPALRVLILEKAKFPRDHIGESLLPAVGTVLNEMEVWDAVEAAGFPVKIGASLTWGARADRWNLDFYPVEDWRDEPRPAKYEGQRRWTAFQVERLIYDNILLRHAEAKGAVVREETKVDDVVVEGDAISHLVLAGGEVVKGRHYVDGTGAAGLLRRKLGVESDAPKALRNIAIWDYWEDAEWAVEIGTGATRIQIRSLPYGWIWFIPVGATRTSVGLVCPATYYKESGKSTEELYLQAIQEQPEVKALMTEATPRGKIESCKDWSHLADRLVGENWFLCGEAAGFADPILSAGLTLAHNSARDVAYTILELERGTLDPTWLRERYDARHRRSIRQHIRFAQYWYSANSRFTDLQDHCAEIAKEAGVRLSPMQAWRWLAQGGFANDTPDSATAGSFEVAAAKKLFEVFDEKGRPIKQLIDGYNVFILNTRGAKKEVFGVLVDGRIEQMDCYVRADRRLPLAGLYGTVVQVLQKTSDAAEIVKILTILISEAFPPVERRGILAKYLHALDAMVEEHWVTRKLNKKKPPLRVLPSGRSQRSDADIAAALEEAGRTDLVKWAIDENGVTGDGN